MKPMLVSRSQLSTHLYVHTRSCVADAGGLVPGATAKIDGLTGAAAVKFNGTLATLQSWDKKNSKWDMCNMHARKYVTSTMRFLLALVVIIGQSQNFLDMIKFVYGSA